MGLNRFADDLDSFLKNSWFGLVWFWILHFLLTINVEEQLNKTKPPTCEVEITRADFQCSLKVLFIQDWRDLIWLVSISLTLIGLVQQKLVSGSVHLRVERERESGNLIDYFTLLYGRATAHQLQRKKRRSQKMASDAKYDAGTWIIHFISKVQEYTEDDVCVCAHLACAVSQQRIMEESIRREIKTKRDDSKFTINPNTSKFVC